MARLNRWHRPGNNTLESPCQVASVGLTQKPRTITVRLKRTGDGRYITLTLTGKEARDLSIRLAQKCNRILGEE